MKGPLFLLALAVSVVVGHAGTPILTYHDVISSRNARSLWFDCTTAELSQQLGWLKRHGANFVTLRQVEAHLKTGTPLPAHAVAITFADNYRGFLLGYPILRRFHVPVTMFVHTGFVGSNVGRPKMSWSELMALDREGLVTVGSETVSHRDLPGRTAEEIRREFVDSKRALEAHLGHSVRYLAYPNGHFDAVCEQVAKSAGYEMAFSEIQKPAEASKSFCSVNRYVHTRWKKAWADSQKRRG